MNLNFFNRSATKANLATPEPKADRPFPRANLTSFASPSNRGGGWLWDILGTGGRVGNWGDELGNEAESSLYSICMSYIAREFTQAPLTLQVKGEKGWDADAEHEANQLILNPHPFMSPKTLWGGVANDLSRGNAFMVPRMNKGGRPGELWWFPRRWWQLRMEADWRLVYRLTIPGGDMVDFEANQVLHFRLPTPDCEMGLGLNEMMLGADPLWAQYRHLCVDKEASQYTHAIMRNGGISPVVIVWKDKETIPNEAAREKWLYKWRERSTGERRGEPNIVTGDVDVKELDNSPEKMALDSILRTPEERVTGALGLNPIALQLGAGLDNSAYNNIAEANRAAWDSGIVPLHNIVADALTDQLLPLFDSVPDSTKLARRDGPKRRFRFDYSEVVSQQDDEYQMHDRARKDFSVGGVSVDEYRRMIRLDPLGEGDVRGALFSTDLRNKPAAPAEEATAPVEVKSWDESCHPRASDGKFGTGSGMSAERHFDALLFVAARTADMAPKKSDEYAATFRSALATVPQSAKERAMQNCRAIKFHDSPDSIGQQFNYKGNGDIGGAWVGGVLHLDGDLGSGEEWTQRHIYLHEIAHAVDNSGAAGAISATPEWQAAWKKEIKKSGEISKYASTNPTEGFAEFGRQMFSGRRDSTPARMQTRFPACYAVWQAHGLVDSAEVKTMPVEGDASQLPEIFTEPLVIDGGLADVFISSATKSYTSGMENNSDKPKVEGVKLEPWSDAELDAMAAITEDDVKAAMATATPEMRALLGAKQEGE